MLLDNFLAITVIANAFKGIKLAVGILILDAAMKMLKKMQKKPIPRIFAGCSAVFMLMINLFSLKVSSVSLMLAAGLISLSIFAVKSGKAGNA